MSYTTSIENQDFSFDEVRALERLFIEQNIDYFREDNNLYTSVNDYYRITSVISNNDFGESNLFITMTSDDIDDESVSESTSPADTAAVEALKKFIYQESSDSNELERCSICQQDLVTGLELTLTPCNHIFHGDCLIPWVMRKFTCPVCRFELPCRVKRHSFK